MQESVESQNKGGPHIFSNRALVTLNSAPSIPKYSRALALAAKRWASKSSVAQIARQQLVLAGPPHPAPLLDSSYLAASGGEWRPAVATPGAPGEGQTKALWPGPRAGETLSPGAWGVQGSQTCSAGRPSPPGWPGRPVAAACLRTPAPG